MKKTKIVLVFSSHLGDEENNKFIEHIKQTIGIKNYDIVCYENYNQFSLTELYNKALNKYSSENVVMVFCHPDIIIRTKDWGRLLLNKFNSTDYDIIGVAGSTYMPESGMWWQDRTKMVGIVDHTDGFKTWTSEYSPERKGQITPTVLIDGLFMAVNPDNLEHHFDEDFKGFHHYDTSFCLPNYLDGCNIGVTTDIRILHKSVGQTNEQWEENRKKLVEKYKDELPLKHVSEDKLKVLICCQFFKNLTGSEMSNYELSKELVKLGCDVTVISSLIGEPLLSKAQKAGVKVYGLGNAPNYSVGKDQKLIFMGNEIDFDILHINHKPIGELILQMYPNTPAVMHVRSCLIPVYEEPIKHSAIEKYISIEEQVTDYIKTFDITDDNIILIDNPFDTNKFKPIKNTIENDREVVLFVGTINHIRKNVVIDLLKTTKENNQELWIAGTDDINLLKDYDLTNVKLLGIVPDVENYYHKCDYSAGIYKGRTTIESWLCGKPVISYTVDKDGNILDKRIREVPEDIEKYSSHSSANKVFTLYKQILNQY